MGRLGDEAQARSYRTGYLGKDRGPSTDMVEEGGEKKGERRRVRGGETTRMRRRMRGGEGEEWKEEGNLQGQEVPRWKGWKVEGAGKEARQKTDEVTR